MFDNEIIIQEVVRRVLNHYRHLGQGLYWAGSSDSMETPLTSSPLRNDMGLLVRVANGELNRAETDDETIGEVLETLQRVIDVLFARANGSYAYAIPAAFWAQSSLGQVVARVQAWLRQDDLINYTEAARILFSELAQHNIQAARMRLKRLVERGELMSYVALDEANPTKRSRVSRQAVEALRAAGLKPSKQTA